jgi:uncharacterized membrane protein
MRERLEKSFGFLKTTALGGLFFLLPLVVVGVLLGYVYGFVIVIYEPLKEHVPVSTTTGLVLLFAASVAILLLLCFMSGIIARRAIGRRFSRTVEKQILTLFPKYAVYKDILADNIGGSHIVPALLPVTIRYENSYRLAFESDRLANGLVVVYLPGSPDSWIGGVLLVPAEDVQPLDIAFSEFLGIFERLGRNSSALLASIELPEKRQNGP